MKMLFLYPPYCFTEGFPTGIALLQRYLKDLGTDVSIIDLNNDFFKYILNEQYVDSAIDEFCKSREKTEEKLKSFKDLNKSLDDIPLEERIDIYKHMRLQKFHEKGSIEHLKNKYHNYIKNIDFKNKKDKTNLSKYISYRYSLLKLLDLISLINVCDIRISVLRNSIYCFTYEEIKQLTTNKQANITVEYFEKKLDDIIRQNPDCIGITVSSNVQLLPALTLAKMLKKRTKTPIMIGGSAVVYFKDKILQDSELFKNYVDYIVYGPGEIAISELLEHLQGKRKIEDVSSIIYMNQNDKIKITKQKFIKGNNITPICYEDIEITDYYDIEPNFYIEGSRGCYWNKCLFCIFNSGNQIYEAKSLDKVIEDVKDIKTKFNIDKFLFTDSSVSPDFAGKFAEKLIKEKIKIYWTASFRPEKYFTKKLLKKLYKSGLRMVTWGVESGSDRILSLYQKGTNIKDIETVLKNADSAGIFSLCNFILGFAEETGDDLNQTIEFISRNKKYFGNITVNQFFLTKEIPIYDKLKEKYDIDSYLNNAKSFDGSILCPIEWTNLTQSELEQAFNSIKKIRNSFSYFSKVITPFTTDAMLFYLAKYGKKLFKLLVDYYILTFRLKS